MPGQFEAPMAKAVGDFAQTELTAGNPLVVNPDQNAADSLLLRAGYLEQQRNDAARQNEREARRPVGPSRPRVESRDRVDIPTYTYDTLKALMTTDPDRFTQAINVAPRYVSVRSEPPPSPEALPDKRYRDEISRRAWQLDRTDRRALVAQLTALGATSDERARVDLGDKFRQQAANIEAGGRRPPRHRERQPQVSAVPPAEVPVNPADALEAQGQEVVLTAEQIRQELLRLQAEAVAIGRGADFSLTVDEIGDLTDEGLQQVWDAVGRPTPVVAQEADQEPLVPATEPTPAELDTQIQQLKDRLAIEEAKLYEHFQVGSAMMASPHHPDYCADRVLAREISHGMSAFIASMDGVVSGGKYSEMASEAARAALERLIPDFSRVPKINQATEMIGRRMQIVAENIQETKKDVAQTDPSADPDNVDTTFTCGIVCRSPQPGPDGKYKYFLATGNVGDSAMHIYRPNAPEGQKFIKLTKDHSLVQRLVDAQVLKPEEAFFNKNRNIITRTVGDQRSADFNVFEIQEGDVVLAASDGIGDQFPPTEGTPVQTFEQVVAEAHRASTQTDGTFDPDKFCQTMIEKAKAVMAMEGQPNFNFAKGDDASIAAFMMPQFTDALDRPELEDLRYELQKLEEKKAQAAAQASPPTLVPAPVLPPQAPPSLPNAPEFSFDPTKPLIDQIGAEIARSGVVHLSEGANGVKSILRSLLGQGGTLDGSFTQGGFIFAGENVTVQGMNVNISGTLTQAGDGKRDFLSLKSLRIDVNESNTIKRIGKEAKAAVIIRKLDQTDKLESMLQEGFNDEFMQNNQGVTIDSLQLSLDLRAQVLRGTIKGRPVAKK